MALSPTSSHGSSSSSSGIGALLYDYEVTGSVKANIDTNVDGALAGLLSGSYKALQVRLFARTDQATVTSSVDYILNNDTGGNYDRESLSATGASAISNGAIVAQTSLNLVVVGATGGASMFALAQFDLHNYAGTVGQKPIVVTVSIPNSAAATMSWTAHAANYRSTSAVSRFKFTPTSGNFAIGTRLTIFGF